MAASATSPAIGSQDAVVAFLQRGGLGAPCEDRIDTHAAMVFLVGDSAWKLKRDVRFDYLDFSSPEKRHAALDAELRLNRRTAPSLYRALHPVTRTEGAALALDGRGIVVDWVLEMQRFPQAALLDHMAGHGQLSDQILIVLADRIYDFHKQERAIHGARGVERLLDVIEGNGKCLGLYPDVFDAECAKLLIVRHRALIKEHAKLIARRARNGSIRHCHGDLHLANIAMIDGKPTPFDCLEFNAELATSDTLYDLAFLLMDLWQLGLRRESNMVFNRYFDLSPNDEKGLPLLPLFMSIRATIRAHVLAAKSQLEPCPERAIIESRRRFDLAMALLASGAPRLIAVGGLSGSGKSTVARALGGIGRAPGARIVRSDVLRKRLAGVAPETRLSPESYTPRSSQAVYAAVRKGAAAILASGHCAIADAVFSDTQQRKLIVRVAEQARVPFNGLWLKAGIATRLARVRNRGADASDATIDVAGQQKLPANEVLAPWCVIVADGTLDETVAEARAILDLDVAAGKVHSADLSANPKSVSAVP